MSLVGIRDMSIIETPPKDRLSIQTNVVKFDAHVIARADPARAGARRPGVLRPQPRRVDLLDRRRCSSGSCPRRASSSATARWAKTSSSGRCSTSSSKKYDVLLATTIIENGLDIPNVNTIIINRADRYGLSQLYQLRGRVGRSDRPAYAYLLIPPEDDAVAGREEAARGDSASSAISAAGSASRRSTSRFAAPAICSAASRAATSRPSGSRCT